MPECLDYMPWSSVYGLGTMAPAILHVGDYKNDKLTLSTSLPSPSATSTDSLSIGTANSRIASGISL